MKGLAELIVGNKGILIEESKSIDRSEHEDGLIVFNSNILTKEEDKLKIFQI